MRPFWQGREHARYPEVVKELKTNLHGSGHLLSRHRAEDQEAGGLSEAARWYRDYLTSFPDDPDSAATNYLLAEALFESHQYAEAAAEYEHTAYDYPKDAKSATAGYAALVAYQKGAGGAQRRAAQSAWHATRDRRGPQVCADLPRAPGKRRGADACRAG